MSNVIPFEYARRRRNSEEEDKRRVQEVEDAGSDAWAHLLRARKLSPPDRVALATALHQEFNALQEKHPDLRVGEFAVIAGLSRDPTSRDLHKYMLPPSDETNTREKQKRSLRASAEGYRRFLKAIQRKTGESMARLANRVTWATSFHPRQAKDIEESEKLLGLLQEAINRIDKNFPGASGQAETLYEVFMRTAKAKVALTKSGSLLRWPYWDAEVPYAESAPDDFPQYSPYDIRLEDEEDVRYAYWQRDAENYRNIGAYCFYASALHHYEAITSLPRIYLGLIVDWNTDFGGSDAPADKTEKTEWRDRLRQYIAEIEEKRDETTNLARIYYRNPDTGKFSDSNSPSWNSETHHAWLIIYPSPDNRSLVPVIYRPYVEAGVHLIHLSHRNFLKLKDYEFITAGAPISLYARMKELMGFGTGRFEIEEAWKNTAADVLQNPVLRAHRDLEQREQAFTRQVADWWSSEKGEA